MAHPGSHVDHAGGGVHGGLKQQRGHGETVQFGMKTGWEPCAQQQLQRDVDEEGVEHRGCQHHPVVRDSLPTDKDSTIVAVVTNILNNIIITYKV